MSTKKRQIILFTVTIIILVVATILLVTSNIMKITQKNTVSQTQQSATSETKITSDTNKTNSVPIFDKVKFTLSNYNVLENKMGNKNVAELIKEEIRTTLGAKYKTDLNLSIDEKSIVKTAKSIKMTLLNTSDKSKLCTVTVPTDDFGEVIVEK